MRGSVPVSKGDVVHYIYPNNSMNLLFFTPAKGDGNLYYKVANAVTNLELLNAGEVLNSVNLKADINLSNVNENGKSLMAGMAMPSNKYIDLSLGASGTIYTAPANGWIVISQTLNNSWHGIGVLKNDYTSLSDQLYYDDKYASGNSTIITPVLKGMKFWVGYGSVSVTGYFRFIYAQGSESEV
jgi:hypothetical protein